MNGIEVLPSSATGAPTSLANTFKRLSLRCLVKCCDLSVIRQMTWETLSGNAARWRWRSPQSFAWQLLSGFCFPLIFFSVTFWIYMYTLIAFISISLYDICHDHIRVGLIFVLSQSIKNYHLQKRPVVCNICLQPKIKPKDICDFYKKN